MESWGPDPPALTCSACGNHVDPVTLSGSWGSREHPDPFWAPRQKLLVLPLLICVSYKISSRCNKKPEKESSLSEEITNSLEYNKLHLRNQV